MRCEGIIALRMQGSGYVIRDDPSLRGVMSLEQQGSVNCAFAIFSDSDCSDISPIRNRSEELQHKSRAAASPIENPAPGKKSGEHEDRSFLDLIQTSSDGVQWGQTNDESTTSPRATTPLVKTTPVSHHVHHFHVLMSPDTVFRWLSFAIPALSALQGVGVEA